MKISKKRMSNSNIRQLKRTAECICGGSFSDVLFEERRPRRIYCPQCGQMLTGRIAWAVKAMKSLSSGSSRGVCYTHENGYIKASGEKAGFVLISKTDLRVVFLQSMPGTSTAGMGVMAHAVDGGGGGVARFVSEIINISGKNMTEVKELVEERVMARTEEASGIIAEGYDRKSLILFLETDHSQPERIEIRLPATGEIEINWEMKIVEFFGNIYKYGPDRRITTDRRIAFTLSAS